MRELKLSAERPSGEIYGQFSSSADRPDRTPIKLSSTITPDLASSLSDYAAAYSVAYGTQEPVPELVSAMLACFLESDRAFSAVARRCDQVLRRP